VCKIDSTVYEYDLHEYTNVSIVLDCRAALGISATVAADLLLCLDGVNFSHSKHYSDIMPPFIQFDGTFHQPHLLTFVVTNK